MAIGKTMAELEIGEEVEFTKTITETDLSFFTAISGATDPLFMNKEFAKKTEYGKRIVPTSIYSSFVAPILGTELPGLGTIVANLDVNFSKPVFVGDTITVRVRVDDLDEEGGIATMELEWGNQDGEEIGVGTAQVMPPKKEYKEFF